MDLTLAAKRLSALAQAGRLAVVRLLVKAGPKGMAAGQIARSLQITPNTLSAQLALLANAGFVRGRREGRSIIYSADFDAISQLLVYLVEDCCEGRPEVCAPLSAAASRIACCDQPSGARRS
jgi:ArsR family transcriptional regulator